MVQLGHVIRYTFQKITIVADYHAGERGVFQDILQPFDPGEIQMIGGLIEQENCRILDQRLRDREALAPSAGELGGRLILIFKSSPAQGFPFERSPLRGGNGGPIEGPLDHDPDGIARVEMRILRDVLKLGAFAKRNRAAVGRLPSAEDFEQRRFARAIGADQPEPVAFAEVQRKIQKQRIRAERFADALRVEKSRQI